MRSSWWDGRRHREARNAGGRDSALPEAPSTGRIPPRGCSAETTPTERAAWLDAIADALDAASSGLVPVAVAETHLGTDRCPR